MLEGSCLCGGIRYQYHGDITEIAMCHCGQCRRGQGTGFVTNSPVERARFQLLTGAELIREYRASPLKVRTFCGQCGSPLYSPPSPGHRDNAVQLRTALPHFRRVEGGLGHHQR